MRFTGANQNILNALFDFILPRYCVSCKSKLQLNQDSLCNDCYNQIQLSTKQRLQHEFERKFLSSGIVSDFYAPFIFEKDKELQHAIHALKYNNRFRVGIYLGKVLSEKIREAKPEWQFELIIPVPLHRLKKAQRGYNQSLFIAKGAGKNLGMNFSDRILKRIKYTESQTSMTLVERAENISGAFKVTNAKEIKDKSILIVDDVITTGATISECGRALINSGANKIYAASIAVAD